MPTRQGSVMLPGFPGLMMKLNSPNGLNFTDIFSLKLDNIQKQKLNNQLHKPVRKQNKHVVQFSINTVVMLLVETS